MPEIPLEARTQFGAFTAAQAQRCGWNADSLKYAVAHSSLVRLRKGIYVAAPVMDGTGIADQRRRLNAHSAAAALGLTASAVSHRSSAVLAGVSVLNLPRQPCLTVAAGRQGVASGIHLHRTHPLHADDVVMSGGVRRTSSSRTVVDIARESGIDEAVVVADSALHEAMTDAKRLAETLARCQPGPGSRRIRATVELADGRAESALESISRLRIGESTLPVPQVQSSIYSCSGRFLARGDFLWDEYGVVGEADGMEKYDTATSRPLRKEKDRQERLERAGLIVVRWGWRDLENLDALWARIRWAFGQAGRLTAERRWISRAG